ncbi:small conductance mechanosensitive channel [Propionibacterium cyclohexanicum]|uniref:Small conductance mechanosensitive channel n=1 Tax=Propionibacterium cyclohexanicum TaxID=64702 RepID=A0A1H9RS71_9ACTN|nr:mechanosensitive ion channel domain-containing protein [Propionibacterium cyclohexanicum]SER74759.1 small conductance mechanosensitive channel [Propionibacterium cyclohexanicum]
MIPLNIEFHWPGTVLEIVLTVGVALLCRIVLHQLVRRAVAKADQRLGEHTALEMGRAASMVSTSEGLSHSRGAQRTKTMGSVLMSITDAVLVVIVVLTVLNSINVNIRPALASAGILGVAVGFGAQSLVKDLFSGIFMIMEDQYGVGDIIEIGKLKGTVRSVGFRVTEVQDFNGEVWYVRNGDISTVGNVSQGYSQSFINLLVSIEEDPHRVIKALTRMLEKMDAEPDWHNKMLEEPVLLGLTAVDATTATYQVMIKCPPNAQWEVEREIRVRALTVMARRGISMPRQLITTIPAADSDEDSGVTSPTRRRRVARTNRARFSTLRQSLSPEDDRLPAADEQEDAGAGEPDDEQAALHQTSTDRRPRTGALPAAHPSEVEPDPDATRNLRRIASDSAPEDSAPDHLGGTPQEGLSGTPQAQENTASDTEKRRARAWLGNAANRRVRWVSTGATGHDMSAEETVVLSAEAIRQANERREQKRDDDATGHKGSGRS